MAKYLCILVLCLGLTSAKSFFKSGFTSFISQVAGVAGVKDPFGLESKIYSGLLQLKNVAQNGDPRLNIPPLDPITFNSHFFHLNDSENDLEGYFHNITVEGHSNYSAVVTSFKFLPQPQVGISITWPLVLAKGYYNLSGYIFDNNSITGAGQFEARLKGLNVTSELEATLSQSWLQITNINISYHVDHLWINHTDDSDLGFKTLNETLVLGLADEAQHKYLPKLLDALKDLTNSFLLKFNYRTLLSLVSSFI